MPLDDFSDKEVRKRPKPELNERWWKQAWPGGVSSNYDGLMRRAIKDYKAAKRGTSRDDLEKSLKALKAVSDKIRGEAKKQLKLLPKRQKAILGDLDAFDTLVDGELATLAKFGTKTRVVYKRDFRGALVDRVRKISAYNDFDLKKDANLLIEHSLLDAVVDEIETKNALAMLNMQFNYVFDDKVKQCAGEIKAVLDDRVGKDPTKTGTQIQKIIQDRVNELRAEHDKVPTNVIRKLGLGAAMEAHYRKKVNKRRGKIAINTVMLGGSAAAVALPGTQGFAIYGLARSTASLAQEIAEHTMNMAARARVLEEQLQYLHSTFITAGKKSKAGRGLSETGGTTLNALLGVDIFPTLDKAKSNLKNLEQHIAHGQVKTQKMIGKINDMLDASNKANELVKKNKGKVTSRKYKKLQQTLVNQETVLDAWLHKAVKYTHQLRVAEKKIPKLRATMAQLGKNSKAQNVANLGIKVVVNLGGIAAAGMGDASGAYKAAVEAGKQAQAVASVSIATVSTAKELAESTKNVVDEAKS